MLPFHPYADLFPLIEGEDFAALVADIKANDLREKIVVWDGAILDGRNRYRAALSAGLLDEDDGPDRSKYFTRFVVAIDGDPLAFVISKNLRRRHLNESQRAMAAAKIANLSHGGDRRADQAANLPLENSGGAAPSRRARARLPPPRAGEGWGGGGERRHRYSRISAARRGQCAALRGGRRPPAGRRLRRQ